ncbi:hypothetical protein [Nonomuraea turkmeniaca]|nr:hypothetical protein [Nonomuraea turkmeniaca]
MLVQAVTAGQLMSGEGGLYGSGAMAGHVPLAMTLFGLSVWLLVWAWRR